MPRSTAVLADCVKAVEKYPDYVQLRFQLCRTLRRDEDQAGNANDRTRHSKDCMQDAVDDARARGYLVSAFTRSAEEEKRNQEYRVAVQHVQQNVGNIVSDMVNRSIAWSARS
jgi:hypothetical protein